MAALDVDRAGARVFDFNGMKADLRAFRQLVPCEGHPVHALSWSPSGVLSCPTLPYPPLPGTCALLEPLLFAQHSFAN